MYLASRPSDLLYWISLAAGVAVACVSTQNILLKWKEVALRSAEKPQPRRLDFYVAAHIQEQALQADC
jgi:hypothetical protein